LISDQEVLFLLGSSPSVNHAITYLAGKPFIGSYPFHGVGVSAAFLV